MIETESDINVRVRVWVGVCACICVLTRVSFFIRQLQKNDCGGRAKKDAYQLSEYNAPLFVIRDGVR